MTNQVAFVRGINVGGKMLKMAVLKSICAELGLEDVRTLLNSGNVVFRSKRSAAKLEKELEAAIRAKASLDVRVMVRSEAEVAHAIEANPFTKECRDDPGHTLVVFLEKEPALDAMQKLRDAYSGPEPMELKGRELYIYYCNGAGMSKLTPAVYEKKLGVAGTARNWNTVTKVLDLMRA